MTNIVIDTCTVIHIIKGSLQGQKSIETIERIAENPNLIISVATKAELESFSCQNKWGEQKVQKLTNFLNTVTIIGINPTDHKLIDAYVLIDGYSKRKLTDSDGNLLTGSAHKMGKNDLWIAATALVTNAPLISTDGDFDHLITILPEIKKIV